MATKYLINNARVGTVVRYAGQAFDTTNDAEEIARVEDAGGVLLESTAQLVAAAALAERFRQAGSTEEASAVMLAGSVASNVAAAAPATRQVISGAGLTGGGTLSADRTLAVGAGSGITVNADDVAVTWGASGDMAALGVGASNVAGTATKAARADHVHAGIQWGVGSLTAGTATISTAKITAQSAIVAIATAPGGDAITDLALLGTGSATVVGDPGSFVVQALNDSQALIATARCDFVWIVLG